MSNNVGVASGTLNWNFQRQHIERPMDNAAYQAAHPDDTLVLAGPARLGSISGASGTDSGVGNLLPIGMLQAMQWSQSKPTQPMMAIGSGRSFFVSGKAQTQWSISRLFVNGRNLLRVLNHNLMAAGGVDPTQFDDPTAITPESNFFINLDSEAYYVPFGIGALFRNKVHDWVGAFYTELAMINSYGIGVNAGQSMIMENVSGVADRIMPMSLIEVTGYGAGGRSGVPRATIDAVLDFGVQAQITNENSDGSLG